MTRLRSNHTRCWHRHSAGHWHWHSSWHWHWLSLHGCSLWLGLIVSHATHLVVLVTSVVLITLTRSTTTLIVVLTTTVIVLLLISTHMLLPSWMRTLLVTTLREAAKLTTIVLLDIVHQQSKKTRNLFIRLIISLGEVLSLVALPVLLVLVAFVGEVTLLFHFVVVDVKGAVVYVELGILYLACSIRSLEADESEGALVIFLSKKFEGLNLTVVLEEVSEVFFSCLREEILNIQVASLLWVLIFKGLVLEFLLSLALFKGRFNIKNFAINFFVVHFLDCFGGTSGSILAVSWFCTAVANESVKTIVVLRCKNWGNVTENFEGFLQVGLLPFIRNILDENVIVDLSEVSLALWCKLNTNVILTDRTLWKSSWGTFGISKANETIATWGIVFVDRNLARNNITVGLEKVFKITRLYGLGDFSYEEILLLEAGHIRTE